MVLAEQCALGRGGGPTPGEVAVVASASLAAFLRVCDCSLPAPVAPALPSQPLCGWNAVTRVLLVRRCGGRYRRTAGTHFVLTPIGPSAGLISRILSLIFLCCPSRPLTNHHSLSTAQESVSSSSPVHCLSEPPAWAA